MASGMPDIPTLVVIDGDPHHMDIFIDASQNATIRPFKIDCVKTLEEGINRCKCTEVRAIFISLSLLDRQALETLDKVSIAMPNAPILIMAGARDAEIGLVVLRLGARGYPLVDHLHRDSLVRAIREMAERTSADEGSFAEEKRVQITLDSIGDTALNTPIEYRITSIRIGTGKSLGTGRYCTGSAVRDP